PAAGVLPVARTGTVPGVPPPVAHVLQGGIGMLGSAPSRDTRCDWPNTEPAQISKTKKNRTLALMNPSPEKIILIGPRTNFARNYATLSTASQFFSPSLVVLRPAH